MRSARAPSGSGRSSFWAWRTGINSTFSLLLIEVALDRPQDLRPNGAELVFFTQAVQSPDQLWRQLEGVHQKGALAVVSPRRKPVGAPVVGSRQWIVSA